MDSNGTRLHLLLGERDWSARCVVERDDAFHVSLDVDANSSEPSVTWDADRHELTLGERVPLFAPGPGNAPPSPALRRGIAVDAFGDVFFISSDEHEIMFASSDGSRAERYWSSAVQSPSCEVAASSGFQACREPSSPQPLTLRGLAVTSDAYLVAGVVTPPGLLVFDLHVAAIPRRLLWPSDTPFEPFDMVATPAGGVAIVDRAHRRLWELDRTLAVSAPWVERSHEAKIGFTPDDGTTQPQAATEQVTIQHSTEVDGGPRAVEALNDGSIIVLHTVDGAKFSTVSRYGGGRRIGPPASLDVALGMIEEKDRDEFALLGYDFAYVTRPSGSVPRQVLYIVASGGDQAFSFEVRLRNGQIELVPVHEFIGIRSFGGRGIVSSGEKALYDFGEQWIALVPQQRERYAQQATIRVKPLDGKEPDCVWHRLFVDACIPAACRVTIETRAANDAALLDAVSWNEEPALIRRPGGSELPWNNATLAAGIDTWELLFQNAKGRYLEIRLTMRGTGRSSPHIRALRAYYPRFSYLTYLPAVYREQPQSAHFLDRFLALFEGFFTSIEDRIAAVQVLLDTGSAPSEALDWLAEWFGVALDPSWSDDKRRMFLRHAAAFFGRRGTRGALIAALRLTFEDSPPEEIFDFDSEPPLTGIRIVENFRRRGGEVARITPESLNPLRDAGDVGTAWSDGTDCEEADDESETGDASPDQLWRRFVKKKYRSFGAFNEAHPTTAQNWSDLQAPNGGSGVSDEEMREWEDFKKIVAPVRESAHRFTVYIPLPPGSTDAAARLARARRIVKLEKPAHTVGDVDFYFTWFRLGEARLGEDTVVDLGSLSPYLLQPFILRQTRLGMGYLAHDGSRIGPGRFILARSCTSSSTTNVCPGGPS